MGLLYTHRQIEALAADLSSTGEILLFCPAADAIELVGIVDDLDRPRPPNRIVNGLLSAVGSAVRRMRLGLRSEERDDLVSDVLAVLAGKLSVVLFWMPRDLSGGWPPLEDAEWDEGAEPDAEETIADWYARAIAFACGVARHCARRILSRRARADVDVEALPCPRAPTEDDLIASIDADRDPLAAWWAGFCGWLGERDTSRWGTPARRARDELVALESCPPDLAPHVATLETIEDCERAYARAWDRARGREKKRSTRLSPVAAAE